MRFAATGLGCGYAAVGYAAVGCAVVGLHRWLGAPVVEVVWTEVGLLAVGWGR